jgi:hypothetical protein
MRIKNNSKAANAKETAEEPEDPHPQGTASRRDRLQGRIRAAVRIDLERNRPDLTGGLSTRPKAPLCSDDIRYKPWRIRRAGGCGVATRALLITKKPRKVSVLCRADASIMSLAGP